MAEMTNWDEVEKDREAKKHLVVQMVSQFCIRYQKTRGSEEQLVKIASALKQKSQLDLKILSGGLTNYSYKLFISENPSLALFAKLTFPKALWCPDAEKHHYDLERTTNEFNLMETMDQVAPGSVAKPYLCTDVPGTKDTKLLVTEWSKADEQLANQMIDGRVDPRVSVKVGETLAKIHCFQNYDPKHNDKAARSNVFKVGGFQYLKDQWAKFTSPSMMEQDSELLSEMFPILNHRFCRSFEKAKEVQNFNALVDAAERNYYDDRDCLIHSDYHAFNILVEAKSGVDAPFGPNGNITVCDWEMALVGPLGRDAGMFHAFPIACAIAHAVNGDMDNANHLIFDTLGSMMKSYLESLQTQKEWDADKISHVYQRTLGWAGWFTLLAHYFSGLHNEYLPLKEGSSRSVLEEREIHRDACGMIGFELLEIGYGPEQLPLSELQLRFHSIVREEMNTVSSTKRNLSSSSGRKQSRRSSSLRACGRRVSDAGFLETIMDAASSDLPTLLDE